MVERAVLTAPVEATEMIAKAAAGTVAAIMEEVAIDIAVVTVRGKEVVETTATVTNEPIVDTTPNQWNEASSMNGISNHGTIVPVDNIRGNAVKVSA